MTPTLTSAPDPQLLSQAIAACTVGVVMTDARHHDHPIVYVNAAFEALSGYAADEILGHNCHFLQSQDCDQPGAQVISEAMAQQRSATVTLRNYRKDGTLFYNEVSLSPVHDASGTLTHYLGFQNDVTVREEAQVEQRASEERFAKIFEAAPIAIVVSRVSNGHYLDVNTEFLHQSGYSREEVIGRTGLDLNFWVDPLELEDGRRTLQEQGRLLNREVQFRLKSGAVADTVVSVVPVTLGGEACLATLIRVVTLEKQAQRVLAGREERYRRTATQLQRTLDLSPDLIASIDAEGRLVTMSAACQQILGYTPEELIGRSYLAFVHPDDRAITAQEDEHITAGQATTSFQNRCLHKNGSVVWLEWAAVSLPGDPLMYCVARDITKRRAAEEDQAFLAAIVQASHDAVLGVTLGNTIRSWNAGAEELYGYTAAEAVGQPVTLIVPPELHAEEVEMLKRAGQGERIEPFDSVRIAKDGRRIAVFVTVSSILDVAGRVIGVSKIAQDITARQAAEREIQALNEDLMRQVDYVTSLRTIDQSIASSTDPSLTLGLILDNIRHQLGVDAVTALLLNPETLTLDYAATRGFSASVLQGTAVKLGAGLAGQVALSRQPLSVPDLGSVLVLPDWRRVVDQEGLTAYYAAPLIVKGQVVGVIEVLHRRVLPLAPQWLEMLETLVGQAAIAVDNAQLFAELERKNLELRLAYDETIEGWSRALDLRDKETEGHSRRVTEMTVALCQRLGTPPEQLVHVRRGALLHDIGKMGIRDAVLLKPGQAHGRGVGGDEAAPPLRGGPALADQVFALGTGYPGVSPREVGRQRLPAGPERGSRSHDGPGLRGGGRLRRADQRPPLPAGLDPGAGPGAHPEQCRQSLRSGSRRHLRAAAERERTVKFRWFSGRTAQKRAGIRAQLRSALRRAAAAEGRADDAEYLANLSLELDVTGDPRVISEHVATQLQRLTQADQICISFGTVLRGVQVVVLHGEGPPQFEAFRHQRFERAEGGVFWERIESGEPLFVDDYPRSRTTSPFMRQAGLSAVAHLPFGRLAGEVGVLTAFRFGTPRRWTARERTLLDATARTLGHAVQRAQNFLELDQAVGFLKALVEVIRLTETPMGLYETARQAAESMAGPAQLDLAVLAQVDGELVGNQVHFRSAAVSAELVRLLEQGLPKSRSLAWRSLQQSEALFIDRYQDSPVRIGALVNEGVQALAFVPLTAGDPARGLVLIIARVGNAAPWSENDRNLFLTAAQSVQLSHERQLSMERLREAALTDPLTRLGNRRALEVALLLGLTEARKTHSGLGLISLDLDGLKVINDREGHDRGDALLAGFAAALRLAFRGDDALFRVGGDEFVVLVKHPAPAGTAAVGSLARVQVALERLRSSGFSQVNVSAGIATFPDDCDEAEELLRLSDQRMYLQKQEHKASLGT